MMKIADCLQLLHDRKQLLDIDLALAEFLARAAGKPDDPALLLLTALVSNAFSQRNESALPISRIRRTEDLAQYLNLKISDLPFDRAEWLPRPEPYPDLLSDGNGKIMTPLVQRNGLLYLGRSFQCELFLRDYLYRQGAGTAEPADATEPDLAGLTDLPLSEEQRQAVLLARNARFLTVSGGPGTGKTTIVALILALRREPASEIILCAPTGKAQMRMKQSLNRQLQQLHTDRARIEELTAIESATIHHLLRWNPTTGTFRYSQENPLPCSLVIVDECSMIPLQLMKNLLAALPETASVILLGDRHQLASVEAGSVFGDFCDILGSCPGHLVELTISHRFKDKEGIGVLKNAIRQGRAEAARDHLFNGSSPQLRGGPLPGERKLPERLREEFDGTWINGGHYYYEADTLEQAWAGFEDFRILTPVNAGPYGTGRLNELAMELLGFRAREPMAGQAFLMLKNHYQSRLFNGDTGLLWYADRDGQPLTRTEAVRNGRTEMLVFFPDIDASGAQSWRGIPLNCLPEYAPAYAFTIHKSQGSDYRNVLILLPDGSAGETGLLTRELLYTGITRAKQQVSVMSSETVFMAAVRNSTRRISGLKQLYAAGPEPQNGIKPI